jgi:LacI family transcriptional regulator
MSDLSSKAATINDVARGAGVSYQTVSRVINNHPSVRDTTRLRVQRVMSELNYLPNRAAQNLASQRTRTLGLVSFGITFYGPAQMLANIERSARARGYGLAFSSIPELSETELERALLELRRQSVDGLLIIASLRGASAERISTLCAGVPFVLVDTPGISGIPAATIDQYAGGVLAAHHLIALGHTRIALLQGPARWNDARLRSEGWRKALAEAGLSPVATPEGDWSPASGFALTQELLAGRVGFTGLLVANDQMALGALWALHERGIRVPEEVSVVGFDDIPESRFFHPPLTTVRQDFAALGVASLDALLEVLEPTPNSITQAHVLTPELIVRTSTAGPSGAVRVGSYGGAKAQEH